MLSTGAERFVGRTTVVELLKMVSSLGNHLKLQVGQSSEYHFDSFTHSFLWS
jgi:hypothetical protein